MSASKIQTAIFAFVISICSPVTGAEFFTLVASKSADASGDSQTITINAGDTAELKYTSVNSPNDPLSLVVITQGKTFSLWPYLNGAVSPVKVAGPAQIRLHYHSDGWTESALATIEVNRAGTASNAAAIPQEAGTVWQVILEASSDLVNWSPVNPGDYPASSPQRYFRTRLVKRS